jgi:small-conductance mechanosensitive channel
VQRGLVIASVVILFGRKSILDGLIPHGEHPAWRAVRGAIVRLRPMILAVALAILVLPHLGYPFFASFLESIAVGGILIAAGAVFAHRAAMELWHRLAPNLDYGVKGSDIAEARRKLLDQVVHTLSFAFFTVAAYVAFVSILRVGEEDLVTVDIGVVAGRRLSVLDVLRCFAVLAASFVLANWTRRSLDLFFLPLTKLDIGTRYAMALTSSYVVIVLGVVAACLQLGLQFGDFAILLGAAGFAIGLGLQQAAANFLSGLSILFTRPVKVGDVIESESRIGTVKMINIVSTVIVTPENHEIRIPNGDILGKRLVNQTGHDPKIRATCRVSVAYGTDIDKARAAIVGAVKQVPAVDPRPAPQVVVAEFGDSGIALDVWIWTGVGIREREEAVAAVQSAILAGLRGAGIEIPVPQRDLHIKEPVDFRNRPGKE